MKTNKYGETLYPNEKGQLVPWYISNLEAYGNSVIPRRDGLTEESILKDYGIKVKFREADLTTVSDARNTKKETCLIADRID